jgi:hypothetical protein
MQYRLGADGTDGEIDCIHLVYTVLERLQIPTPAFKQDWYAAGWRQIARDLLTWGDRIDRAEYDGDVLLMKQDTQAFAVTWQTGILYINSDLKKVAWCPASCATNYHCFRLKGN